MSDKLTCVFAGTPDFAAAQLQALLDHELIDVCMVLTQPDRPQGRGKILTPSPVKTLALTHNIPIYQPVKLDAASSKDLLEAWPRERAPDLFLTAAYGLIIPEVILNWPRYSLNVHASLLPKYRGAAPIQAAILAGDDVTGVCIMTMEKTLDTGPVAICQKTPISKTDTAKSLHDKLAVTGQNAVKALIDQLNHNALSFKPQAHDQATYAGKINKQDGLIDWQKEAFEIERTIRAYTPWPGGFFEHAGEKIKALEVSAHRVESKITPGQINDFTQEGLMIGCGGNTLLQIIRLQRPGKKPTPAGDLRQGKHPFHIGTMIERESV